MVSYKICEIFKNTFYLQNTSGYCFCLHFSYLSIIYLLFIKLIKYARRNFVDWRVFQIQDNYLEAAIGGALSKAVLKNFAIFTGKQLCWSHFLVKLQTEKRLQHRVFLCILRFFKQNLFWKISASGCFWLFFYYSNLFVFWFSLTLQLTMIFYSEECLLKLDYVIQ